MSADVFEDTMSHGKISEIGISTTTKNNPDQETNQLANGVVNQFTAAYESSCLSVPSIVFLDNRVLQNGRAGLAPSVRMGCLLALDDTSSNVGLEALASFATRRDLKVMPIADDCFWTAVNEAICALRRELSLLAMCWKLQRHRTCLHGNTPPKTCRHQDLIGVGPSGLFITSTQLMCLLQLQCHTDTMVSDAIAVCHRFNLNVKSFGFKTFST